MPAWTLVFFTAVNNFAKETNPAEVNILLHSGKAHVSLASAHRHIMLASTMSGEHDICYSDFPSINQPSVGSQIRFGTIGPIPLQQVSVIAFPLFIDWRAVSTVLNLSLSIVAIWCTVRPAPVKHPNESNIPNLPSYHMGTERLSSDSRSGLIGLPERETLGKTARTKS